MPEPGNPVRGAVVGLGAMGAHHLRVLRSLPEVDLVSVVDVDEARRRVALDAHPGVLAHASLAAALSAGRLDFVCLAVPVAHLPEATHEALAAGVHVLVEKPTAPDEEAARAMVDDAHARGLVLGVGHVERANPAVVALRRKLDQGLIGNVLQMHARRLSPFPNRGGAQGVAL
ncbi:MAG: Gfo/Idh/MocA family oxidoreductase, partial [Actinomycetota bacterium]|nr:Gfo/Idh/MocA family oxidoreductase [Actinomycetota bacterium]